jgi:predicted RNA-binding Zn-ribbon protein involved in translation (DUF1610 family)
MASWVFICKNCGHALAHSAIADNLWNYYLPSRPVLPTEGISKVCPQCSATFTYRAHELTYEKS